MGTSSWKPGCALAEAAPSDEVKPLNVQGKRGEEEEDAEAEEGEEEEEHEDEGLALWTEEYPDEKDRGSRRRRSLHAPFSASQKLSSSLDRARQCSSPWSSSLSG